MKHTPRSLALLAAACAAFGLAATPAHAIGCFSGAAAGAVAGHVAGHHAVIGAAGGCIAGHELAKRKKREAEANKLIADYGLAPAGSARQVRDLAEIDKLARQHVPIAQSWVAAHHVQQNPPTGAVHTSE